MLYFIAKFAQVVSIPKRFSWLTSKTLGRKLLEAALLECPALDGIFCTNDDIAVGTILACNALKINVPESISIIGYNNLDIGQAITPTLTSIYTPRYEIGEKSAELLLNAIEGKIIDPKIYDLGFELTKAQSF